MCEIDEDVIAVAKKYFPDTMGKAFNDPRLELVMIIIIRTS